MRKSYAFHKTERQGGEIESHRAHTPENVGASPTLARRESLVEKGV